MRFMPTRDPNETDEQYARKLAAQERAEEARDAARPEKAGQQQQYLPPVSPWEDGEEEDPKRSVTNARPAFMTVSSDGKSTARELD